MKPENLIFVLFAVPFGLFAQENAFEDFGSPESAAKWELFIDTVMGGKSQGENSLITREGDTVLRLEGSLSLENNGGFVQARRGLSGSERDRRNLQGIAIRVRSNLDKAYVHLKDPNTWLPWAFWEQPFYPSQQWQVFRLPFENFESSDSWSPVPDQRNLDAIAVVAAYIEGDFWMEVDWVDFY